MKFYNKLITITLLVATIGVSCKKLDSLIDNPNSVDPSQANVDLLLNGVGQNFTGIFNAFSDAGGQLTRQQAMSGPLYNNAYTPTYFDGTWTSAYTGVIKNSNALIPLALQQKKYVQAGIAQTLKAYTLGTLVDYFGDVPNSEAVLGQDNLNPKSDPGANVYKNVFTLLDSAISNFSKTGAGSAPTNDIFYNGSTAKWKKAAKTLKLKFLMQSRLVDASVTAQIQSLITENDLIVDAANDFTFKYSTVNSSPDSRHPHYGANYNNVSTGSNTANDYIGTYFMWVIGVEKSGTGSVTSLDPRRRFYFYRQNTNYANVNSNSCPCNDQSTPGHYTADMPFCLIGAGYWGRDHGDATGVPPDNAFRTTWGVYPAAGEFDASQNTAVNNTRGGKGAGIDPIFMSSFTYFLQAEAALKLGITSAGTPKSLLEKGVRASITKVLAFPATVNVTVPTANMPTTVAIDAYVTKVNALYDAAVTDADRLDVIMKEYYIASWGNGIEPYNNYRRTGSPNNMQFTLLPTPGFFIRSFFYPSVYVNRNFNSPAQKTPGTAANKVFWDNNPDNFIK
jgi:Starch-binding associating with outer membrane/Susd and RagB outer membrane lipoprotein